MKKPLRVTVTGASGLAETGTYDRRGRLASVHQTGDGTTRLTRYVYDNAEALSLAPGSTVARDGLAHAR